MCLCHEHRREVLQESSGGTADFNVIFGPCNQDDLYGVGGRGFVQNNRQTGGIYILSFLIRVTVYTTDFTNYLLKFFFCFLLCILLV